MKNQLIQLYLLVCQIYDNQSVLKDQRLSNFKPVFSDQELLTCYFFGLMQHQRQQRAIYEYIRRHWSDWFPRLPSYQAFNRRLNNLSVAFELVIGEVLRRKLAADEPWAGDFVIDSFPVMIARGRSAKRSPIARGAADFGYCASKRIYYHGVKLHALAARRVKRLPVPLVLALSQASRHDLTVFKELAPPLPGGLLLADKAYDDRETKLILAAEGTYLLTGHRRKRNEPAGSIEPLADGFVSALRQPIEAFFKWLIDKTDLQNASRVRSTNGLLTHCYGKLAFACLLLCFYS